MDNKYLAHWNSRQTQITKLKSVLDYNVHKAAVDFAEQRKEYESILNGHRRTVGQQGSKLTINHTLYELSLIHI